MHDMTIDKRLDFSSDSALCAFWIQKFYRILPLRNKGYCMNSAAAQERRIRFWARDIISLATNHSSAHPDHNTVPGIYKRIFYHSGNCKNFTSNP